MKCCIGTLTIIFLFAAISGCVTPPYDPLISRSEIYERVDILAMVPLQCPDFDRKEEVGARYEALITGHLEASGFKVIPSEVSSSIKNSMIEQMGGIFDPTTGDVDAKKAQALNDHIIQEMNSKFNIDAFIVPRIVTVKAAWRGDAAKWDGVTEATTGKTGFLASVKTSIRSGTIPAMSLVVVLKNKSDSESYYVGRGGIQLLTHYGETLVDGFVDVPVSEWFVDEERDVKAVSIALYGLDTGLRVLDRSYEY